MTTPPVEIEWPQFPATDSGVCEQCGESYMAIYAIGTRPDCRCSCGKRVAVEALPVFIFPSHQLPPAVN